ncbi:hypothetical protein WJX73_003123 [Symbiochloris irregularis]|uniref:Uncharacterized protein n=1 Tax=Symbiochloris irregularis TaxID=706552 RepID=A0AAW1NVR0_9CHLO
MSDTDADFEKQTPPPPLREADLEKQTPPLPFPEQPAFENLKKADAPQFGATEQWKRGVSATLQYFAQQASVLETVLEKELAAVTAKGTSQAGHVAGVADENCSGAAGVATRVQSSVR